jgi:short-subunit dehydrogenase
MKEKNVVITGATKGIGLAIVELLASKGYHIALCARTGKQVRELIKNLQQKHPNQTFYGSAVDVSKMKEVSRFAGEVNQQFDQVDVLINNAGVFIPGNLLEEENGMLEKQLNTNLMSAYTLTRLLAPDMVKRSTGDIVNICSVAGIQAYPNGGSYCISKFAMRGMSLVLREELKEKGVRVTTISPGATWSNSWAGSDLPPERLMPAADIAKAVLMAIELDASSVMEEIILRPQLGDL